MTARLKLIFITGLCLWGGPFCFAQQSWWDLLKYEITINPSFQTRTLVGSNVISFQAIAANSVLPIDLAQPLKITAVSWRGQRLPFNRQGNVYQLRFPKTIRRGSIESVTIQYAGIPKEVSAEKAPFESGWIWSKDEKGCPWMSLTCEGSGASIWLPCKNQSADEPDSGVIMHIVVPDSLIGIGNGRMLNKKVNGNGTSTYTWAVVSPINHYDIVPYIGKYVHWEEVFHGLEGPLDCQYWVLEDHLEKARLKFREVDTMLRAFEYWMGPYPFYKDGYKLVEAPEYGGMEHQSNIAYGNKFKMGLEGHDLSGTGIGLKWDFIIVHESGHEWFGNSITGRNDGPDDDSWIHEGFTKYTEVLFTDYVYGAEAANTYYQGLLKRIKNDKPAMQGSSDKYYKGAAFLHNIHQQVGDSVFRGLLHGLNKKFYHQTVSTQQVVRYISDYIHKDITPLFDLYMRTTNLPPAAAH